MSEARKAAKRTARQIMGRSNYMTEAGQTTTILCKEVLLAEITAALLDAEARGMERAAEICDAEAATRLDRADNPWPGDPTIAPFTQDMVQRSKAITASNLAIAIRTAANRGRG